MFESMTTLNAFGHFLFWGALVITSVIGFLYFRDLGDVTQMVMKVKRENMHRFIRNEYRLLTIGLSSLAIMVLAFFTFEVANTAIFSIALIANIIFYGFTYIWVHYGLRHQQKSAKFYSIEEAKRFVSPSTSVIVIENNGVARAHPDYEIWRPHLAGDEEGLGGENVILTYCSMTNLGHGYKPEINGEKLNLEVLAQHGNNLIMRDNNTGEPIQQMHGNRECDGVNGPRMQEWPTFRMSFQGFERAYPEGKVFLNKASKNPFLWLVDFIVNTSFAIGIAKQNRQEAPIMENMSHSDSRLPNKTNVWGFNVGDDYVCYTKDFINEHNGLINTKVGDKNIVVAYDQLHESVGVYYNDNHQPVSKIDFFGNTPESEVPLKRVETVKAGLFWHVWVEFNRNTDLNRV